MQNTLLLNFSRSKTMVNEKDKHLNKLILKKLANKVNREIIKKISSKKIRPVQQLFHRKKITKFQYTEKGITDYTTTIEYFTKDSWHKAISIILQSIKKSKEYYNILESNIFKKREKNILYIDSFIKKIYDTYFQKSQLEEKQIEIIINDFLRNIENKPVEYETYIELEGIILQHEYINIKFKDMNIILRKTDLDDLIWENPVHTIVKDELSIPTAIMIIKTHTTSYVQIKKQIEQIIAILRLFKVGSVKTISQRTKSSSIIDPLSNSTIYNLEKSHSYEKYSVKSEDVTKLQTFCKEILEKQPQSLLYVIESKVSPLSIAFKRYSSALLENGLLEKRILNSMMGLEALYLRGQELQELNYRLSMRLAKILSFLNYNPIFVKETIKNAYSLRSKFVHGSQISQKDREKLLKKYQSLENFIHIILDYLRVSLIILTLIKVEKGYFLTLIDGALIDDNIEKQLLNKIDKIKTII